MIKWFCRWSSLLLAFNSTYVNHYNFTHLETSSSATHKTNWVRCKYFNEFYLYLRGKWLIKQSQLNEDPKLFARKREKEKSNPIALRERFSNVGWISFQFPWSEKKIAHEMKWTQRRDIRKYILPLEATQIPDISIWLKRSRCSYIRTNSNWLTMMSIDLTLRPHPLPPTVYF